MNTDNEVTKKVYDELGLDLLKCKENVIYNKSFELGNPNGIRLLIIKWKSDMIKESYILCEFLTCHDYILVYDDDADVDKLVDISKRFFVDKLL